MRSVPSETPVTTSHVPPLSSRSMRRFSAFVCGFSSISGRVSGTAVWCVVEVEVVWWLKTTVSAWLIQGMNSMAGYRDRQN